MSFVEMSIVTGKTKGNAEKTAADEKEETLKPIGIFSTEQGENSNEICFGFKRYK